MHRLLINSSNIVLTEENELHDMMLRGKNASSIV